MGVAFTNLLNCNSDFSLGKAVSCREPNLDCWGTASPRWCETFAKKCLHGSCRVGRRIVVMKLICSLGHCECDCHRVHKLSQRRLTADWLAPRDSDCSRMRSKVSSHWLLSYIKATRSVLEIFKMAGYFPDSHRMCRNTSPQVNSHPVTSHSLHFWSPGAAPRSSTDGGLCSIVDSSPYPCCCTSSSHYFECFLTLPLVLNICTTWRWMVNFIFLTHSVEECMAPKTGIDTFENRTVPCPFLDLGSRSYTPRRSCYPMLVDQEQLTLAELSLTAFVWQQNS
jgi:hypothetical protein